MTSTVTTFVPTFKGNDCDATAVFTAAKFPLFTLTLIVALDWVAVLVMVIESLKYPTLDSYSFKDEVNPVMVPAERTSADKVEVLDFPRVRFN